MLFFKRKAASSAYFLTEKHTRKCRCFILIMMEKIYKRQNMDLKYISLELLFQIIVDNFRYYELKTTFHCKIMPFEQKIIPFHSCFDCY